jgi:hypothetical protein
MRRHDAPPEALPVGHFALVVTATTSLAGLPCSSLPGPAVLLEHAAARPRERRAGEFPSASTSPLSVAR